MANVAVVTGGTGGIGLAVSQALRDRGWTVRALSRSGGADAIAADVTDLSSVQNAIAQIADECGGIDLLVNNAGSGISGPVEFTCDTDARAQFDVNFFGALNCVRAAMPYLRESKGRIINVSSVAALLPIPFQAFYSASKAAVNALTLALANEVRPLGVRVCAILPGDVKTGFTDARRKCTDGAQVYGAAMERAVAVMEHDERAGMPPETVARVLLRALDAKRPRPFYVAGGQYRLFAVLAKLLPASATNRLVGAIYR